MVTTGARDGDIILVAGAQIGGPDLSGDGHYPAPLDLMSDAAAQSLAQLPQGAAASIDTVTVIRTFADSAPIYASPFGKVDNYPAAVAGRLGLTPRRHLYPHLGGNTPQATINQLAADIAAGRSDMALLVGGEAMLSQRRALKAGAKPDWSVTTGSTPTVIGDGRMGVSLRELSAGLGMPITVYPLFENALAHARGQSPAEHQQAMGALFAPFSAVAADHPASMERQAQDADTIATVTAENRVISWPHTRAMCAKETVDLAASVIITSAGRARALGIPEERWVYLRGTSDVSDKWFTTDRRDFHTSPAIRVAGEAALTRSGLNLQEIDLLDIYSCFPCAVSLACDALGLAPDDPRGLTVTGGLPFFGGPGNNYSLHAIAEVVSRIGNGRAATALITANGWFLTKQSIGVYAKTPGSERWQPGDDAPLQAEIDALPAPAVIDGYEGDAMLETFTIPFGKGGPQGAILIGRSTTGQHRFIAHLPATEQAALTTLMQQDMIGQNFTATRQDKRVIARF